MYIECYEYVIDITATQFGDFPKVIMRLRNNLEELSSDASDIWRKSRTFANVCDLKNWQIENGWPDSQTCQEKDIEYLGGKWEYKMPIYDRRGWKRTKCTTVLCYNEGAFEFVGDWKSNGYCRYREAVCPKCKAKYWFIQRGSFYIKDRKEGQSFDQRSVIRWKK